MSKIIDFIVKSNEALNYQNHLIKVSPKTHEKLTDIYPGQFVQILVEGSPSTFLRRPISVNFVNYETNELWLLIQIVGEGTKQLSKLSEGETLNIILPLGKSFSIPNNKSVSPILIGGGVGIAPLLYLGKMLKDNGIYPEFILGGRSERDLIQLDEFQKYGKVHYTTEDGSKGEKGFVTNHSVLTENRFNFIYTCGPKPMMVAVAKYAHQNNIECEVSLENLMACGFGACLCCIEKTIRGNVCACTEGPVFNINELTWID